MPTKRSPKAPLPEGVVWWRHLERHPLNEALGIEMKMQRLCRAWSLRDLSRVTGIAKSYLWGMERMDG